ncbi:MAG TPA: tetratricopeptide repeat protein [Rhizomicrobium sp.]|jgi:tetratricopeptide (TPR) repeat protein
MSRTALYKGLYFAILGSAAAVALAILVYFRFAPIALLAVLLGLLLPGRILGFFWRDLLRGLRLLNAKDYAASKASSLRFLAEVRRRPWIKHLVWLGSSSYSRDPEILALNNLGGAEIGLREFDAAEQHLNEAISIDPLCPLPFYNLGVLAMAKGNSVEATRCFAEAKRLGYRGGLSDRIVRASQTRFAETDGG